jgi:hypothetical protein
MAARERNRGAGPPATPTLLKAAELLKSGSWFDYETILREVGKAYPPGEAIRRNEQDRVGGRRSTEEEKPRKLPISDDRAIQAGRRAKARDTLSGTNFQHQSFAVPDGLGGTRTVHRVRMLQVPAIVKREWTRVRAREHFVAVDVADELMEEEIDMRAMLTELTPPQLFEIAMELAKRQRRRRPPATPPVAPLSLPPLSVPSILGFQHKVGGQDER